MYQYKEENIGSEPISLDEAKAFMRVSFESDDTQIQSIITRVRQMAEQILSRSFVAKTITYYEEIAEKEVVKLPFPNHSQVLNVYVNGVDMVDNTTVRGLTQLSVVGDFVGKEIRVIYTTDGTIESGIKSAMLKEIVNQYQNKDSYYLENAGESTDRFRGMLRPYIKMSF